MMWLGWVLLVVVAWCVMSVLFVWGWSRWHRGERVTRWDRERVE